MMFPVCNWRATVRSASLVSFDVFDTLVARPFADPASLFEAVGDAVGLPNFRSLRITAESAARQRQPNRDDITFDDIYRAMVEEHLVAGEVAARAKCVELRLERALCGVRPVGRQLYDEVRSANPDAILIAISDMYLPTSEIEAILHANGYHFEHVFVSSEYGRSKHSGGLFDVVRERLGISATQWVHVGDNPWSDGSMARSRGIRVLPLPYAEEAVPSTRPSPGSTDHDRIAHLALEAVGSAAWPDKEFSRLAAHVGGPMIVGLARQVRRDADVSGADTLLFLGRDGYVVEEVYARLYPADPRPRIRFAGSRRVVVHAQIERIDDTALSFLTGCKTDVNISQILARVGVKDPASITAAKACLSDPEANDPPIHELINAMHAVAPALLHEAAKARHLLLAYLRQEGVDLSAKTHVVDIGWGCSIQTALTDLLRKEGWSVRLCGTYLGTKNDAPDDVEINGWLFQRGLPADRMRTIFHCLELPELLFAAPEFAVAHLVESNGTVEPSRPHSPPEEGRVAAASAMRPAVLAVADWAHRLEAHAPSLADRIYSPERVCGIYESVVRHPVRATAEAISTVEHGQGIGETGHRPIVDPASTHGTVRAAWRARRRSFWHEGATSFLTPSGRWGFALLVRFHRLIELGLHVRRRGTRGAAHDFVWWGRHQYWRLPESTRFRIKRVIRLAIPGVTARGGATS